MAFDASVGGANSNSYVTLAAAEAYFLGRLDVAAWDSADGDDDKESALMMATARLDLESYSGAIVTTTQRLQWPRSWVPNRANGFYSSTAIPQPIQDATCELALRILDDPDAFDGGDGLEGFANLRLGSLDLTPVSISTALPPFVLRLIAPVRVGGFQNRVVRA